MTIDTIIYIYGIPAHCSIYSFIHYKVLFATKMVNWDCSDILIGYIHSSCFCHSHILRNFCSCICCDIPSCVYYNLVHCFRKCKRSTERIYWYDNTRWTSLWFGYLHWPDKKHTIRCVLSLCICCAKYFNHENSGTPCIGRRLSFIIHWWEPAKVLVKVNSKVHLMRFILART